MSGLSTEDRDELKKGEFAFPEQRKEPLENASHVRNAISRFNQVKDVTDDERDAAWKRIKAAARKFDVEVPRTPFIPPYARFEATSPAATWSAPAAGYRSRICRGDPRRARGR